MSEILDGLYYTDTHEWLKEEGGIATIGITDYAQEQLGDIVFIELPEKGKELKKEDVFGTIESVKSVSELISPVSGTVTDINESLTDSPETLNKSPYNDGWIIKIKISDASELDSLMQKEAYEKETV